MARPSMKICGTVWRPVRRTGRRTVPQIFIDGRSIGGFEELAALDARAELAALTEEDVDDGV